jgi:TrpR-related protein YerC/YecD
MEQMLRDNQGVWELFDAITLIRRREECASFFRDLCTIGELEAMAERWQVARMIEAGMSYRKISQKTGASTTTVTRVAHWLKHGEGGYRLMLRRAAGVASGAWPSDNPEG